MPTRYCLIAGTFLLSMLLYVDRVCISAAKDAVAGDLQLDDRQMGWIFAAFSLGYALLQTPVGVLADRRGPRRILTAVVCLWSLFTALTAAARQFWTMLVVRFLFGAGEAGAFPAMARVTYSWLPMSERGLAQGINFSATRLGAAFALPGVAWLVAQVGWRLTFVLLGGAGFVGAAAWFAWFRDDPADHPAISAEELAHILQHRQRDAGADAALALTAWRVVRSINLWLLMGQYFASNFTFYFCLTWLLPHLAEHYRLSPAQAGAYAMMPFVAGMAGNWVGGVLVDAIYRRGSWQASRQFPATAGFVLATAGLAASLAMADAAGTALCLSLAVFGSDMTLSASWSLCIDIGRRHAGAVSGTMNMAGNLGSFVTALAFPYLRAWTGSTMPFFVVGAGLNLLAIAAWQFTRADQPVEAF
jgi:ACS family glucarate transporter-like MFS transporter